MGNLIQLSDAKTYLQIGSTDDELLNQIIAGVSAAIESHCGRSLSGFIAVTDVLDGGVRELILSQRPVASITTVMDRATDQVVDESLYDLDAPAGLLFALASAPPNEPIPFGTFDFKGVTPVWGSGRRRWQIEYTAGSA